MKKLLWFSSISFLLVLFSVSNVLAQWTEQTSGTTDAFRDLHVVNDDIVWASGVTGLIAKTTDGGATWTIVTEPNPAYDTYSIFALDADRAWTISTGGDGIRMYKTTDGGNVWTEHYFGPGGFGNGVRFFDENNGVAFGDPVPYPGPDWEILTTSDGGDTWTRVPNTQYPGAISGDFGYVDAVAIYGNSAWFGSGANGEVWRSTDKGHNWSKSAAPEVVDIFGMDFRDEQNGILINFSSSTSGKFSKTTDGGATWTTSAGFANLRSIANVPGSSKWITVGGSASVGSSYISHDDGATWTEVAITTPRLRAVDASAHNAWAVGDGGKIWKWSGAALPVELTSFAASAIGNKVELKWSTATETNNKGFEVERKAGDDNSWITIGFKEGSGTTSDSKSYSYTDELTDTKESSFSYRLKQVDFDGSFEYSNEVNVEVSNLPTEYSLNQNYPNPFNPSTVISYALPFESNVKVTVFSALGEEVSELVNSVQNAGCHEFNFDAKNLSSGLYFYNIEASALDGSKQFSSIKKMLLVR